MVVDQGLVPIRTPDDAGDLQGWERWLRKALGSWGESPEIHSEGVPLPGLVRDHRWGRANWRLGTGDWGLQNCILWGGLGDRRFGGGRVDPAPGERGSEELLEEDDTGHQDQPKKDLDP